MTSVKNVISLHYPVHGKCSSSPALARALYRQPRLLLLNEGTANLDEPGEEALADILSEMTITRIVIAHRPALMNRAATLIEVNNDQITVVPRDIKKIL